MLSVFVVFVTINLRSVFGTMYSINDTEYSRLPPLYALDDYRLCLQRDQGDGLYCLLDADLFSPGETHLLHVIHEYSDYSLKHFNHTQIHRGICVTRTCSHLYINNTTEDLARALGTCLNETIWDKYRLQVRLKNIQYCDRQEERKSIDVAETAVAVVYAVLVALNVVGSWYHIYLWGNKGEGSPWLLAFSVQRNWQKLTTSIEDGDPRKKRLKAIHGMRTMTLMCVLFSHTVLMMAYGYIDNPLYIEKAYDDPLKQILFNGSLVIQTFFLMSSFLLTYNYCMFAETHRFSWWLYPKGIVNRWLRLTPTYALVLATISTWMVRLGDGPMWRLVVESEAQACRQYWWSHLFYFNNYLYGNAHCMPQTWYLAADTQLFCIGMALATLAWRLGPQSRPWLLGGALVAGVLAPGLHTYFQDLDAVVLQSPETYRNLYERDDTFRIVYSRGHTNLGGYTLGLIAGYIVYSLQTDGGNIERFKRYRWLYWAVFPTGVGVILTGGVFYMEGARAPLAARVLYAALYKIVFTFLVACCLLGSIFKVENVYRSVMEWRGWRVCGRVSYCAFLMHTMLQRGLVGSETRPIHMSDYYIMTVLSSTILMSFLLAVPLCLLVEMPLSHLQRHLLEPRRRARAQAACAGAGIALAHAHPDGQPLRTKL